MMTAKELEAQVALNELATRLYQRADPQAQAVLEALEVWCQLAENLGHPARGAARQQIQRWVKVQERMRGIASGLTVVGEVPGGNNGRT